MKHITTVDAKDFAEFLKRSHIVVKGTNNSLMSSISDAVLRNHENRLAIEAWADGVGVLNSSKFDTEIDEFISLPGTAAFLKSFPKSGSVTLSSHMMDHAPWIQIRGRGKVSRQLMNPKRNAGYGLFYANLEADMYDTDPMYEEVSTLLDSFWKQIDMLAYRCEIEEDVRKEIQTLLAEVETVTVVGNGEELVIKGGDPESADSTVFEYHLMDFGEELEKTVSSKVLEAVFKKIGKNNCTMLFNSASDGSGIVLHFEDEISTVYYSVQLVNK